MKKKLLSTLLCVAMVSTMLVGCGETASKETDKASTETEETATEATDAADASAEGGKVYYLNFKPEVEEAWNDIAAAYTEETGVDVKVVTAASGTYEEVLKSEIAKEDAPTLFQVNGPVGYSKWKDYCKDLSDTEIYAALSDQSLAVKGTDGTGVYGIPCIHSSVHYGYLFIFLRIYHSG